MRAKFFAILVAVLVASAVLYFLWLVIKALVSTIVDLKTSRNLDKLAAEYANRRRAQRQSAAERLQNGCEHYFNDAGGALPPNVCCKCGLAKERPATACDHVWRVVPGIIPQSRCEQCGMTYSSVPSS
jgi:hypothetical protein